MADEATPQENATEAVEAATEAVENASEANENTDIGTDVQGAETDIDSEADPTEPEKPAGKTYDEKYVKKLRAEAANARVKGDEKAAAAAKEAAETAQKALTEQIARTLGLIKDDTPPDPAELLKQAQEREQALAAERDAVAEKLRSYARKDAITAAVNSKDVDGDLESILDSRKITSAIDKLDTTSDDFAAQVAAIVAEAVESNPKLKKAPAQVAAPRSGGDLSGGNANPRPSGSKSVDDFRREIQEHADRKSR